jgi:hypothetical protein
VTNVELTSRGLAAAEPIALAEVLRVRRYCGPRRVGTWRCNGVFAHCVLVGKVQRFGADTQEIRCASVWFVHPPAA